MVWNIHKLVRFVFRPITSNYVVLTFDDGNICFIFFFLDGYNYVYNCYCFLMIFFLAKKLYIECFIFMYVCYILFKERGHVRGIF